MYVNITPEIRVKKTINDPLEPIRVYGFMARNTRSGRGAVLLKDCAESRSLDGPVIAVPEKEAQKLREGYELLFAENNHLWAMSGGDFEKHYTTDTHWEGDRKATMYEVPKNDDLFRVFEKEDLVSISTQ